MNTVHDSGGSDGFGRVVPISYTGGGEPVFKADWERRMFGVFMATIIGGLFSDEDFRQARERLDPVKYLTRSYYEQWYLAVLRLLVEKQILSPEEVTKACSDALRAR